jgi:hypothetical protein
MWLLKLSWWSLHLYLVNLKLSWLVVTFVSGQFETQLISRCIYFSGWEVYSPSFLWHAGKKRSFFVLAKSHRDNVQPGTAPHYRDRENVFCVRDRDRDRDRDPVWRNGSSCVWCVMIVTVTMTVTVTVTPFLLVYDVSWSWPWPWPWPWPRVKKCFFLRMMRMVSFSQSLCVRVAWLLLWDKSSQSVILDITCLFLWAEK